MHELTNTKYKKSCIKTNYYICTFLGQNLYLIKESKLNYINEI